MATHTHDQIDWPARLESMRREDAIEAPVLAGVARRLVEPLPPGATIVDVGSGSGGMSVQLVTAVRDRGGRLVLVDAVPELLAAAVDAAERAAGGTVEIVTVQADAAALADAVPAADLLWASHVVHHLPDQLAALNGLVALVKPGGRFALAEGGLPTRCLPWDIGLGEPGLQDRMVAARDVWFARMRAEMADVRRMPIGWNLALAEAGLVGVESFSYLVDCPAPASADVRASVLDWIRWMATAGEELLGADDNAALARLTDPDDPAYVLRREDVYLLQTRSVHTGSRPGRPTA